MLHIISGANGAGKTLNTLKWVRERQLKENRPVCHNGRFESVEGGELAGWKKIDFKDWQAEPDGTIFLIDEAHNDLPNRPAGAAVPDPIKMLAEHRRRGFDFYLVTQHPQNLDSFVRRLVGPPGWHRHLKRSFGVDMVSMLEWSAVNPNCEKDGSGKTGTVTMQAFPKEVYGWYKSASLHTGKKKLPAKLWVFLACVLLIPLLIWFASSKLLAKTEAKVQAKTASEAQAQANAMPQQVAAKLTPDQYIKERSPRLKDFPHTAPAYDEVTKPTVAPYPAACITMGKTCKCYSQQATLLQVSGPVCLQIVAQGFFVDWQQQNQQQGQHAIQGPQMQPMQARGRPAEPPPQQVRTVPMPTPQLQQPGQITQADIPQALGIRNPAFNAHPHNSGSQGG
ncbi:zonular occludens toxin domain-containing protein [Acidovorax sp. sif1233]|uniref:zonular occludens toxin domain-containing protein n=1 Tax=Acidovorax sp. sif1233 TaxID=2854792 RepID=UPI001C441898|nr:zonular occludens toxin domain-containing protein [Acidovorax sp. sif1233]MBV7453388.1 zonular occludens toxin domain-containing protein [Acidovorax sp. sif1233]